MANILHSFLISTAFWAAVYAETKSVNLTVTVPRDTPSDAVVQMAGGTAELGGWSGKGLPMKRSADGRYQGTINGKTGETIEFKFTLGSWETVEKDANGGEIANRRIAIGKKDAHEFTVERWASVSGQPAKITPRPSTLTGDVRFHEKFHSRHLGNDRTLAVYLPPGYEKNQQKRYPVLYMHDGQNLFDSGTSFIGVEWGADETAERLIKAGKIRPIIMVGIYNNAERMSEYSPPGGGGKGERYARFIIEEVKPFIDTTYRTQPGREATAIAGSSMGGLISLYIATNHANVFSMSGVISPALTVGKTRMVERLKAHPEKLKRVRFWIDMGTEEGRSLASFRNATDETRKLAKLCERAGLIPGKDFVYREVKGGIHNETAWAARFDEILLFFFARD